MAARHFSMWPLREAAMCGAEGEFQTTELGLVNCDPCRAGVIRAEILGEAS